MRAHEKMNGRLLFQTLNERDDVVELRAGHTRHRLNAFAMDGLPRDYETAFPAAASAAQAPGEHKARIMQATQIQECYALNWQYGLEPLRRCRPGPREARRDMVLP